MDTTTSTVTKFQLADGASTSKLWRVVSKNSRKIGAQAKRIGDQVAVVTYGGSPRNFVTCASDGSNSDLVLDSRTKIVVNGSSGSADTLYIVTHRGSANSAAFSSATVGRFEDGMTCRATGTLERHILGQG